MPHIAPIMSLSSPVYPPPIQIPVEESLLQIAAYRVRMAERAAHAPAADHHASNHHYDFPVLNPAEYDRCVMCSILLRPSRVSFDPYVCESCLRLSISYGSCPPVYCGICCSPAWRIHRSCHYAMCHWCLYQWTHCPWCREPLEE